MTLMNVYEKSRRYKKVVRISRAHHA